MEMDHLQKYNIQILIFVKNISIVQHNREGHLGNLKLTEPENLTQRSRRRTTWRKPGGENHR